MTQFFNGQKILFINRILFDDAFITVVEVIFFSVYLKLSFSDFSSIMGLCLLISLLVQIPTGYLSDKFDRKLMLVLGNGAEIVCLITLLFLPSLIKGSLFIPVLIIEIIRTGMLALASGNFEVLIFNMFKREGKTEKDFMEKSASYFSIGAIIAAISGFVSTVLFSYLVILPLILDLSIKIIKLLSAIFMCSEARHKEMTKIKMKVKSLNHKLLFLLFSLALLFCISRGTFSLYQPVMTSLGIPLYYYGLLIMIVNLSIFVLLRVLKKKVSLFKLSTLLLVSFVVLTFVTRKNIGELSKNASYAKETGAELLKLSTYDGENQVYKLTEIQKEELKIFVRQYNTDGIYVRYSPVQETLNYVSEYPSLTIYANGDLAIEETGDVIGNISTSEPAVEYKKYILEKWRTNK